MAEALGEVEVEGERGEDAAWPLWMREGPDHLAELARYVSDANIAHLDLSEASAHQLRAAAEGPDESRRRRQGNRGVVERLYAKLQAKGYLYTDDPVLVVDEAQRIRDPHELDAFAGTCLDAATTFASMCVEAKLAPLIVVGTRPVGDPGGPGHAWVLVDLERDPTELASAADELAGRRAGGRGVVYRVDEGLASALHYDERYLAIDPSCALRGFVESGDVEDACDRGRRLLGGTYRDVRAVEVLATHAAGLSPHPLPRPSMRPVISRHLPSAPSFRSLGADRDAALAQIAGTRGTVVVIGESGMGKSMLALRAAALADGGFGWFLGASNERALIRSLAMAEAHQVGRDTEELGKLDYDDLAAAALVRLHESKVPWVVVVDNANGSPRDLRKWMPVPSAAARQLLVVTTTNPAWVSYAPAPVRLKGVKAAVLGCPDALQVRGRPLFATAFHELAATLDISIDDLAALPEVAGVDGGAEDLLWSIVRSRLPEAATAARFAAWLPADDVDLDTVALLAGRPDAAGSLRSLLTPTNDGRGRMHRLVGAAIRRQSVQDDPDATIERLRAILATTVDLDVDALREIAAVVGAEGELRRRAGDAGALGVVQHGVGTRLEPLVGVELAATLMSAALQVLPEDDLRRRADCLHAAGRFAFQHRKNDLDALANGRRDAERAIALREQAVEAAAGDPQLVIERWRSVALLGLLEVQFAVTQLKGAVDDNTRGAANELALAGNARIDVALAERTDLIGEVDDLDLLRGQFNQAFAAVNLAQQQDDPSEIERWLALAFERYRHVGAARREHRSKPMAQVAACDAGQALVLYLRAMLGLGLDRTDRKVLLREASLHLDRAMRIRESVEPIDGVEVAKTARLELKIAFARFVLGQPGQLAGAVGEVLGELWSEPRRAIDGPPLGGLTAAHLSRVLGSMWVEGTGLEALTEQQS